MGQSGNFASWYYPGYSRYDEKEQADSGFYYCTDGVNTTPKKAPA